MEDWTKFPMIRSAHTGIRRDGSFFSRVWDFPGVPPGEWSFCVVQIIPPIKETQNNENKINSNHQCCNLAHCVTRSNGDCRNRGPQKVLLLRSEIL
jgi:hypothetical protein